MLFGGDFQAGVYDNGGKVDTKLSISEVEKIAKATANEELINAYKLLNDKN